MFVVLCEKPDQYVYCVQCASSLSQVCFEGFVCRGRAEQKILLLSLMGRRLVDEGLP